MIIFVKTVWKVWTVIKYYSLLLVDIMNVVNKKGLGVYKVQARLDAAFQVPMPGDRVRAPTLHR